MREYVRFVAFNTCVVKIQIVNKFHFLVNFRQTRISICEWNYQGMGLQVEINRIKVQKVEDDKHQKLSLMKLLNCSLSVDSKILIFKEESMRNVTQWYFVIFMKRKDPKNQTPKKLVHQLLRIIFQCKLNFTYK